MKNKIFICAAVILFLALLGLLAHDKLEIYDRKAYTYPSNEYYANSYLALERWLNETGHPVRIESQLTPEKIAAAEESVVVVFESALCRWENTDTVIYPWIEQGGCLILCIDYKDENTDEHLLTFLAGFGISFKEIERKESFDDEESIPDFSSDICFQYDGVTEIFTIKDHHGNVRLAEIPVGKGALTVIGKPRFMNNYNIKNEINAALAWNLTGARANGNNAGVAFFQDRGRYTSNSLFGKIMERGNLLPVGISVFLVIFIGFWTVIPVFGLVLHEKPKNSRPIKERFLAEIRFLKKYKTLNHYLDVYNREHKIEDDPEKEKGYNYRELINQYRRIFDGTAKF